MTQLTIDYVEPRDPRVSATEARRLSSQCLRIVERLRKSRATNVELAALSLKYTARVSDLRARGYVIEVVDRDRVSGLCVYELKQEPTA
jgi:hypothetical protein